MKTAFEEFLSSNQNQAKPDEIKSVQNNLEPSSPNVPNLREIARELKNRDAPIAVIILLSFFEGLKKYLELPMIIKFPILLIVVVLLKLIG